jgi:hypothetical protein
MGGGVCFCRSVLLEPECFEAFGSLEESLDYGEILDCYCGLRDWVLLVDTTVASCVNRGHGRSCLRR